MRLDKCLDRRLDMLRQVRPDGYDFSQIIRQGGSALVLVHALSTLLVQITVTILL